MPRRPRRKFGRSQKDRIFFACFPDERTAARIHALAEELKREKLFEGTLILPELLHVTLFHIGDWHSLPVEIVDIAKTAAVQVEVPPFEVTFNRAGSFRTSPALTVRAYRLPYLGAVASAAYRAWRGAEASRPWRGDTKRIQAHVTSLRDALRVLPFAIPPISWPVRDFVLVHSLLGKATHIHLERWPLRGPRP